MGVLFSGALFLTLLKDAFTSSRLYY